MLRAAPCGRRPQSSTGVYRLCIMCPAKHRRAWRSYPGIPLRSWEGLLFFRNVGRRLLLTVWLGSLALDHLLRCARDAGDNERRYMWLCVRGSGRSASSRRKPYMAMLSRFEAVCRRCQIQSCKELILGNEAHRELEHASGFRRGDVALCVIKEAIVW